MTKHESQHNGLVMNVPFGAICIHIQNEYVVGIELFKEHQQLRDARGEFARTVVQGIKQYFKEAKSVLDINYVAAGTPFQKLVWRTISNIPVGKVITYTELAVKVGSGPRAVANACGANPVPLIIPCHRVVAKNGLGGFMQGVEGGLNIKQWLLAHESE